MHNSPDDVTFLLKSSLKAIKDDPEEAKKRFHEAADRSAPHKKEPCANCGVRHRSRTAEECQDRQMSERTLQDRVMDRAKRRGWKVAHAGKGWVGGDEEGGGQWVTPMSPGWPDLTLAKDGHRLIFLELKKEEGVVEPEQEEWRRLLNATGNRAVVIRPSDLREKRVNSILDEGSPL